MLKIALSPIDAVGHLTPMLAVCRALSRHPHVSAVRGFGQARLAPLFRQHGAGFETTGLDSEDKSAGDLAWKSFVRPLSGAEAAMRRMIAFAPDLVLYDPFSIYGALGAHVCGVPSACLVTMAGYGTLGEDFVRKYAWDRPDLLAANADYARKFGLDFRRQGMMPVLFPSRDLSLVAAIDKMTVAIDPPTQPQLFRILGRVEEQSVSVGPCLGGEDAASDVIATVSPPAAKADDGAFPFDRLAQARRAGKRIVVFSLGTVITDFRYDTAVGGAPTGQAFLRRSLETVAAAVRDLPGLQLVAAIGPRFSESAAIDWPDNAIVRAVLPQRRLLQGYADVFVTHHGASSQAESILAGVPMISLPGAGDQIANARLAGRLQAAVAFWDLGDPYSTCDVAAMRRALAFALDDPQPRRACAALAAEMRRADGAETAAKRVVALAEQKSASRQHQQIEVE